MAIILKEGIDEKEAVEFYLVGLECFEDFDMVTNILTSYHDCRMIEKLDGIYSRIGRFTKDGIEFKLIFHEDVGNYLCVIEQSEENNKILRKILQDAIPAIENARNE